MQKKELLEKFDAFCAGLSKNDRIAIVHHVDADGISSAAITIRALKKISGIKPVLVSGLNYGDIATENSIFEEMHKKKANKLIIVDISIDAPEKKSGRIAFLDYSLIIDHHEFKRDLNREKVLFLNSKFFSKTPSSYPAAKLCFDLWNRAVPLKESAWIAAIGIIGDNSKKTWQKFLQGTIKKNKTSMQKLEATERIFSAVSVMAKEKIPELISQLAEAEGIDNCCSNEFEKTAKKFEKEKEALLEKTLESKEDFPELELEMYRVETDLPAMKSYLINDMSNKKPEKTIILTSFVNNRARFSARRQDMKVKLNEVLQKSIRGIPHSTAGGHIPASAGSVPSHYYEKFEEQLIQELQKIKK